MQRLTLHADRERGAVAVVVAVLMVPLIGFAALAIDVASSWAQHQRLQVAADASALAIAQDCARDGCGSTEATADSLTSSNFGAGADVPAVTLDTGTGRVTVGTSTANHSAFAPILGPEFAENTIRATASAAWGAPVGGTSVLPVTFSWCEFSAQTGGGVPSQTVERVIKFSKDSGTTCTGPSNLVVPGGFGWVDPDAGSCSLSSSILETLTSSTGASMPSGCTTATFHAQLDKVVLLPLFDSYGGTGNNAWYRVYGYAAFRLTGYRFPGSSHNSAGCSNNSSCLKGYFTQYVDLDDAFDYGTSAPELGAMVVELTD